MTIFRCFIISLSLPFLTLWIILYINYNCNDDDYRLDNDNYIAYKLGFLLITYISICIDYYLFYLRK